jgi:hypothetical protein
MLGISRESCRSLRIIVAMTKVVVRAVASHSSDVYVLEAF